MARRREGGLVVSLALAAVLLFLLGEAYLFAASEGGAFFLARNELPFPRPPVIESLSGTLRSTMRKLGVPDAAQRVRPASRKSTLVRWEVRLPPRASLFLVNASLSEAFEKRGARVFDAWEEATPAEGERVTLRLGVGKTVTHEVVLVRRADEEAREVVRLALVLEGFGREGADSLGEAALTLPFPFTGAVLTNGSRPRRWAEELGRANREVVAHLPMEPMNYPTRTPGRDAILVDMTRGRIKRLVKMHLGEVPHAVALLPYMGGMALQDENAMAAVSDELRDSKVAYVEVAGEPRSLGLETAAAAGVPFLRLDSRLERGSGSEAKVTQALRVQLRDLADTARRRGFASCLARLDPELLRALRQEVPRLESQGVRIVPLSTLLRPSAF